MINKKNKNLWKRLILVLILILLCNMVPTMNSVKAQTTVWDGTIAEDFDGGDGTKSNPYQIANASQLALLSKKVNDNDKNYQSANYILTNDIYLNEVSSWKNWPKKAPKNIWQPIGITYAFTGVFDGNGHVIQGMYISGIVAKDDPYDDDLNSAGTGLFGLVVDTTIINLGVEKSCLVDRNYGQGGIAGYLRSGVIENCYFDGIIRATEGGNNGGIVGSNNGTIKNCYNTGSVYLIKSQDFSACLGGIVGNNLGTIESCYNKGNIGIYEKSGWDSVGGIVGNNEKTISNCYNMGKVKTLSTSECGGIAGDSTGGNVIGSYNMGEIVSGKKSKEVGGVVGGLYSSYIEGCYNTGKVTVGEDSSYIGGIAGVFNQSIMVSCYNKGSIVVKTNGSIIGGLVGGSFFYNPKNKIVDSYNLGEINCKSQSDRIAGIGGRYDGLVSNCWNGGSITVGNDSNCLGGILGETEKSKVFNSFNTGKVVSQNSYGIGGIIGSMGAFAIIGDDYPNVKPGIYNCYNKGTIGGKGCSTLGGIVGESYNKSYNCFNIGKVQGSFEVGPIIGRKTLGGNNTPQKCYYLKGCTKIYKSEYKEKANDVGIMLTRDEMKNKKFANKLNIWASKDKKKYSTWKYSRKKNGGYPYLGWQE